MAAMTGRLIAWTVLFSVALPLAAEAQGGIPRSSSPPSRSFAPMAPAPAISAPVAPTLPRIEPPPPIVSREAAPPQRCVDNPEADGCRSASARARQGSETTTAAPK
jgi:hypothetical protein